MNYDSFFKQALEDFNIDQQFDCQPLNTFEIASPTENERFEHEESIENDLHHQIIATISTITKQINDFKKRLGNCELNMSHQLKEDRSNFKDTRCNITSDFILPIEDTKSLKELESKLKNRSLKNLLVNKNAKLIFV